ncbi:hypothetical protein SKAU_G00274770 [Synaphobranchus kaupii]|uniref:Uncharacterized protein n=1 Tax=Synaphobranchus kaupii TaxID=118154 RepID=A0A9Q1F112_SYNKA|nr:hypothetical protein SKAU_G00274770 [Synaphobranchus kaupii]
MPLCEAPVGIVTVVILSPAFPKLSAACMPAACWRRSLYCRGSLRRGPAPIRRRRTDMIRWAFSRIRGGGGRSWRLCGNRAQSNLHVPTAVRSFRADTPLVRFMKAPKLSEELLLHNEMGTILHH